MNNQIGYTGNGISVYAQVLYDELQKRGVSVSTFKIPQYVKNITGSRTINRFLYFNFYLNFHQNELSAKNLHLLSTEVLPLKYLKKIKRKVGTLHDFYNLDSDFVARRLSSFTGIKRIEMQRIIRQAQETFRHLDEFNHLFTDSNENAERLVSEFGIPRDKITVAYPIIEEKFKPMNLEKKETIIGYINNFNTNKAEKLKVFIEKFKQFKDNSLRLHIYGKNFPFENEIKGDERIKYFGFLPEERIVETLNGFSAYLSTSKMEGFGLPVMNAKACKIPVLCYDGNTPKLTKQNTIAWDDEDIEIMLEERAWEKVDVEKAYLDAEECRADKVIPKMLKVYSEVFKW